jgi:ferritin-like metal-binding protein YciE
MAKTQQEFLVAWLNDAHATEKALTRVLENQVADTEDYPQVQARIQQHLEETRRHAELVEGCLQRMGESPSTTKDLLGNMMGFFQSLVPAAAKDDLIKHTLANAAAEHFEIASYKALILAAREVGDEETAQVCESILRDEEEMARWVDQNLPMALREVLHREAEPQGAR